MRFAKRLTLDDRAVSPYLEVPFEVGSGAGAVHVTLDYDSAAAVVDLGCIGVDGAFRGWSGGARSDVLIAEDIATPGYLAGTVDAGEWAVLLGLHRIPAEGVDVVVTVEMDDGHPLVFEAPSPPRPESPPRRELPASPGLAWLACDLHAHTVHSDGILDLASLAALAVESGLDVLAVTDHNTVSHHPHLARIGADYGITLLPGQEVTTDRGHANAFGAIPWVDFRQPARSWVAQVADAGGLLSINHPLAADCAWTQPLDVRPPLAEIWHSGWWDRTWSAPLAWWNAWDITTVPIGGSDFHTPDQGIRLGAPVTWVAAQSPELVDVLEGLRNGRTAISAGIDAPTLLRVEDEFVVIDGDGTLLTDMHGNRRSIHSDQVRLPAAPGPHRLETHRAEVVAISP